MAEDVKSDHVDSAEGGGFGPADCGAGERIDLFNRESHLLHDAHYVQHGESSDAIGDEVWCVLSVDNGFPQTLIAEMCNRLHSCGIRVGSGNDFEKPHVTRRIEEVCAKPVASESIAEALDDARTHCSRTQDGNLADLNGHGRGGARQMRGSHLIGGKL